MSAHTGPPEARNSRFQYEPDARLVPSLTAADTGAYSANVSTGGPG